MGDKRGINDNGKEEGREKGGKDWVREVGQETEEGGKEKCK